MQHTPIALCGTKSKRSKRTLIFSPFSFIEDYPAISGSLVSLSTSSYSRAHVAARKEKRGHNPVPRDNIDFSRRACYGDGKQSILAPDSVEPRFKIAVLLAFNLVRDLETVS